MTASVYPFCPSITRDQPQTILCASAFQVTSPTLCIAFSVGSEDWPQILLLKNLYWLSLMNRRSHITSMMSAAHYPTKVSTVCKLGSWTATMTSHRARVTMRDSLKSGGIPGNGELETMGRPNNRGYFKRTAMVHTHGCCIGVGYLPNLCHWGG